MGGVNFYLKKPQASANNKPNEPTGKKLKDSTGKSLIYLQYEYSGRRLVFSFGQRIRPDLWDHSKQRVKNPKVTAKDGKHLLNGLLNKLSEVCEYSYNLELKNGIPEPQTLKRYLVSFLNQNEDPGQKPDQTTLFQLIDRFISGEIKNKGRAKSRGTLQNYRAVQKHLQDFQVKTRGKIDFDTINLDFFYKYSNFLKKDLKLAQNTVKKDITILKVFLQEAVDLGFTNNLQFKHKKFTIEEENTDAVYLTEAEIISIYNHNFSHHKKLEQVRDLFVFGCFVGLRYSDYSDVRPENIVTIDGELFIKLVTKKTKEEIICPTNPIVNEIFAKYASNANRLPKSFSNQKFNDYVKDLSRAAGMTTKGRLANHPERELWECISSHTARRSFATNYYLQGFPTIDLMKITGHKTEKAFLKYIRVSKLDTAKRLSRHIKLKWSNNPEMPTEKESRPQEGDKLLKVAG